MTRRHIARTALLLLAAGATATAGDGSRKGSVPARADDVRLLHRAFKGLGTVEKVELVDSKHTELGGRTYERLIVLTVNRLYLSAEGSEETRRAIRARVRDAFGSRLDDRLIVIRGPEGAVRAAFPVVDKDPAPAP